MKKVLITGANSYVGMSFEKWVSQWTDKYNIDTIDMQSNDWREKSFKGYDTVFHVAGIAHSDTGKVNDYTKELYYKVNRDLALETANKAKNEGVKQFIFMSSIIVYGDSAPIGKNKIITIETAPEPASFYGDSKLQAENGIKKIKDKKFKVVILRPPMIYGNGCKGNYQTLVLIAKKLPIFPNINNSRSIIFINNFCELVRLIIDNYDEGIFYPQNLEYASTTDIVKLLAEKHGKNIRFVTVFNPIIKLLGYKVAIINKAFGNMVYDMNISHYKDNYRVKTLIESINGSE